MNEDLRLEYIARPQFEDFHARRDGLSLSLIGGLERQLRA